MTKTFNSAVRMIASSRLSVPRIFKFLLLRVHRNLIRPAVIDPVARWQFRCLLQPTRGSFSDISALETAYTDDHQPAAQQEQNSHVP